MAEIIRGKYEIITELGRGGMGVVYKAMQKSLQRIVAIKMLSTDLAGNDQFVKRFRQEAVIIARLDHPNIIRVHDIDESDGTFYIIMEYVEGQSLQEVLFKTAPLPEEQAINVVVQASRALNYAHSHGITHRDIKPDNIMITKQGRVKVMDFGIARLAESDLRTQTGVSMGTPKYMSPEQASGSEVDGRSDIYSLGCVLYGSITGQLPFDGDNPIQIALAHIQKAPVKPSEHFPEINPDLEEIILKCIEKKPDDRYSSAKELADVLESYLAKHSLKTEPVSMLTEDQPLDASIGGTLVIDDAAPGGTIPVDREEIPGGTLAMDQEPIPGSTMKMDQPPVNDQSTDQMPIAPGGTMPLKSEEKKPPPPAPSPEPVPTPKPPPPQPKPKQQKKVEPIKPVKPGTKTKNNNKAIFIGVGVFVLFIFAVSGYFAVTALLNYLNKDDGNGNGTQIVKKTTPTPTPKANTNLNKKKLTLEEMEANFVKQDLNEIERVINYIAKNDYDKAVVSLEPLIKNHTEDHPVVKAARAGIDAHNLYREKGLPSEIRTNFEKAILYDKLWPTQMEYAWYLYKESKNYEKANEILTLAKRNFPIRENKSTYKNEWLSLMSLEKILKKKLNPGK